jgi:hypothetical protein
MQVSISTCFDLTEQVQGVQITAEGCPLHHLDRVVVRSRMEMTLQARGWAKHGAPAFRSDLQILSCTSSIFGEEGLDFQGMWGLSLRCMLGPGESLYARPLVHRQDEPTKLSLGMVASQQSPLPFHLVTVL